MPKRDVQLIRDFAPDRPEPVTAPPANAIALTIVIDGGGVEITDGIKVDVTAPFTATITGWSILADQSGSVAIDIWRHVYEAFAPTNAESLCDGVEPNITATTFNASTDLSSWVSTEIVKGDVLRFNVDSCTDITRLSLSLTLARVF
jgi:hypothetical protein